MTNITSKIVEARSLTSHWSSEKVRHALSVLAELYPGSVVDWEEGDEEWGRVISQGSEMAYVNARCPLIFVKARDETAGQRLSAQLDTVTIPAQDFDTPSISVDPSVLSELTRRPLTKNVSYDRVSVNEIWFATV